MDGFEHKAQVDIVFKSGKYLLFVQTEDYTLNEKKISSMDKKMATIKKYVPELLKGKKILTGLTSLEVKPSIRDKFIAAGHYILTRDNENVKVEGSFIKKSQGKE